MATASPANKVIAAPYTQTSAPSMASTLFFALPIASASNPSRRGCRRYRPPRSAEWRKRSAGCAKAQHANLVWARVEGTSWKLICWRFGVSRATAHRRWQYGLSLIAYRLNGRRLTATRSGRFATVTAHGL